MEFKYIIYGNNLNNLNNEHVIINNEKFAHTFKKEIDEKDLNQFMELEIINDKIIQHFSSNRLKYFGFETENMKYYLYKYSLISSSNCLKKEYLYDFIDIDGEKLINGYDFNNLSFEMIIKLMTTCAIYNSTKLDILVNDYYFKQIDKLNYEYLYELKKYKEIIKKLEDNCQNIDINKYISMIDNFNNLKIDDIKFLSCNNVNLLFYFIKKFPWIKDKISYFDPISIKIYKYEYIRTEKKFDNNLWTYEIFNFNKFDEFIEKIRNVLNLVSNCESNENIFYKNKFLSEFGEYFIQKPKKKWYIYEGFF